MLNSISVSSPAGVIFFLSMLLSSHGFYAQENVTDDHIALLAMKSQFHDPLEVTSSWNTSVNICLWTGVTCGGRRYQQRVTKLDLRNQSIGGTLSPYVGNLSFLRFLHLGDNNFYGEIPDEVGRLSGLETLVVTNNSFSGRIPTNLSRCSNLIKFLAHTNHLVGEIPAGSSWLKLQTLSLSTNQLTGLIPPFIGNLSALQGIDVGENRLVGRIPDSLGQLRSLKVLGAHENNLSGTVPLSIYNLSSLEKLYLFSNGLEGILPHDIGFNLPNIDTLLLDFNSYTGSIPLSLSNASNLIQLNLGENRFTGKVSIDFNGLPNLAFLTLGSNNLGTGASNDLDFLPSLINCSNLEWLVLDGNHFGGLLPHSIANLSTKITEIQMGGNELFGTIPLGIVNLVNLNLLSLEVNQLIGTIPQVIGELKNLQALYLSGNFLKGTIPSSLGNLTLLTSLALDFNDFEGNIPSSLGDCQNMMELILSNNKLNGALPQRILEIRTLSLQLDLSNNNLSGHLPLEVGNLQNLIGLNISKNHFSGGIPAALSACTSLEYLHMQGNSFGGSIPLSLSSLKSIVELDLSNNNLSGTIPKFLENLSFMQYLNLSYNHFEGEVPTKGIFRVKTNFSVVGNGNLCGVISDLHLPSCPSKGSRKSKATLLIKVLIPIIMSGLILSACFVVVYAKKRRSAHDNKASSLLPLEQNFPMISYAELSKATNEFSPSNMIGQGSFGIVYKGILGENEMIVAVKVINLNQKGASRSFVAECEALRNIRHRNLIKIITICSSIDSKGNDFKALVYEYMENGSLEEWLHQNNNSLQVGSLSLIQRLNIAIDVASAIEYLHHNCQPPIVHGDLKPSNVLLNNDMASNVGDFGLARFLSDRTPSLETQSSSIGIKGTIGYLAPEYGMGGEVSMKGDVYSFGILLLEMFTGRRPTDNMYDNGQTLHGFAKIALPEKVMEIADPSMLLQARESNSRSGGDRGVKTEECLVAVMEIGVLCSMESPTERMVMTDVVSKLYHVRQNFLHNLV